METQLDYIDKSPALEFIIRQRTTVIQCKSVIVISGFIYAGGYGISAPAPCEIDNTEGFIINLAVCAHLTMLTSYQYVSVYCKVTFIRCKNPAIQNVWGIINLTAHDKYSRKYVTNRLYQQVNDSHQDSADVLANVSLSCWLHTNPTRINPRDNLSF